LDNSINNSDVLTYDEETKNNRTGATENALCLTKISGKGEQNIEKAKSLSKVK
jgi:hypothetical protein